LIARKKEKRKRRSSKPVNSIFSDGKKRRTSSKSKINPMIVPSDEDSKDIRPIGDSVKVLAQYEELSKQFEEYKQKTQDQHKNYHGRIMETRAQAEDFEKKLKDAKRLLLEKDKELSALTGRLVEGEGLYKGKMEAQKEDFHAQIVALNKKIKEQARRLIIYEPDGLKDSDIQKILGLEKEKEKRKRKRKRKRY